MREKISVIIPVFNLEKEIKKCLFSLILQKYENLEIIVIDDGSTDNSLSICKEIAKRDKRIKVFHKKNGGLSSARNFGISKATGKFLAFVDGDDFVDPNFLEALFKSASKNKADIVVSGYAEILNEKTKEFVPKNETISGKDATIRLLIFQENMEILTWNKLYKRSIFSGIKFPDGKNCEDNLTTYKLFSRASKVSYIDTKLYNYVKREKSISSSMKDLELCEIREEAADEAIKFFKKDGDLKLAAEIAKLLAYLKFIDFSLSKKISEKYFKIYRKKILDQKKEFLENKYIDTRRKKYIKMLDFKNGSFYKLFRKIKHA